MQIMINIPDAIKEMADEGDNKLIHLMWMIILIDAIKNGVVLPKGHGRLGDLDALEKEIVNGIKAGNYEEGYETFAHINDMDDCVDFVRCADTIIEADKEGAK